MVGSHSHEHCDHGFGLQYMPIETVAKKKLDKGRCNENLKILEERGHNHIFVCIYIHAYRRI